MAGQPDSEVRFEDECASPQSCVLFFTIAPVLYIIAATIICLGNILTIVAVLKTPRLQTIQNMYVVSLATSDLLAGVYVFSLAFFHLESTHEVIGHSKVFCLTLYITYVLSTSASNASIVFIAVDRYIYIAHPFTYTRLVTPFSTRCVIAGSWFFAAALASCVIFFNRYDKVGECSFVHVLDNIYQLLSQTSVFFITLVVVSVLYIRILVIALGQRRAIDGTGVQTYSDWRGTCRTVRLLLIVCVAYLLFWTPCHVMLCVSLATGVTSNGMSFAILFGLANSGVNFIIYPLKNKAFRRAFGSVLCNMGVTEVSPIETVNT
ncbi:melatonin receptor type 1B-like [Haliotis cracherodii]|uniref:melatonin receptor type 1B-like n=1 Tax=Haliotis cracherodii TaxID=6455 RepID=UPI0039EC680E